MTRGPSTIGSHYDGSDNFTLQFEGTKEWFLSPPESIPAEDRRRRLLGDPGLGRAAVAPAGARRFQVGPGDALYIPSTWVHWGLSDGDSTSVSLVVNVASPVHALQQQITEALRRDPAWSASLPVGPGTAAERRRLLSRLVAQDVPERLRPEIAARVFDREGSRLVPKVLRARPLPTSNAERQPALPDLAPEASFEPGGPVGPELLAAAAAVRAETNLRRLLGRCDARREETADADARRVYEVLRASLPRLARPDLVRLLNDPAVHAWLDATERELPLSAPRPEDPAAHSLGLLLLPAVAPHHRGEPVVCSVPVAEDGSVLLRAVGLRIRHDAPGAVRTALGVWDGTLHWCGPGGPVPVADGTARDGVRIEPLPTAGPGAAVVTTVPDHGGDSPAAPGRPGTERQLLSALAALAAPGPGRALPGQDRDPYLAWVVVRSAAAPHRPAPPVWRCRPTPNRRSWHAS
ncbi:JmjC domain-containing protein [Streptacidiphilus monticola]